MAIDSKQKRMSSVNMASPWRGQLVDAAEASVTAGNRQAAGYFYSGIVAGSSITTLLNVRHSIELEEDPPDVEMLDPPDLEMV